MISFKRALEKKLIQSQFNNFGIENYDQYRFGKYPTEYVPGTGTLFKIKNGIKKFIGYKTDHILNTHNDFLTKYNDGLQRFYEQLNSEGQELIACLIAYRLLGFKKVKLPRNNKEYWKAIELGNSLEDGNDSYDPHFLHFILKKCDLRKIGYEIQLYLSGLGVAIEFIIEQYAYKSGDNITISVEDGDVVLDLGACWGDTALYFANKTGGNGKVYSFEFIPDNIKLFNLNVGLNPNLKKQIELIQHPVSDKSGENIYFTDNGPGSRIEFEPFEGQTGSAITISIDDFVNNNDILKIDFIKMDIEGVELIALQGAIETIKKFKPKLAIAIYHSMEDFINIPQWIIELDLGYKLYLGHYTIHAEETVLFAKVEE